VPIYFADAIARRSEPLLRTADAQAPLATISTKLAEQLGVSTGDKVTVTQGKGSACWSPTSTPACRRTSSAWPLPTN
jgi:NADH-quinone oxidoreductase subunit G